MFSIMQDETNLHKARQIKENEEERPLKKKSVFAQWKSVTLQELKVFCAVLIHISVLHKLSVHDYWSMTKPTNHVCNTGWYVP
jgi:hypothetical protein